MASSTNNASGATSALPFEPSDAEDLDAAVALLSDALGKDHFDEVVTKFLEKTGEQNVVTVTPFNYTHQDLATRAWVTDFGVMVLYRN